MTDAIAGRIRRLLAMADKRAADLGIDGTDADLTRGHARRLTATAHLVRSVVEHVLGQVGVRAVDAQRGHFGHGERIRP